MLYVEPFFLFIGTAQISYKALVHRVLVHFEKSNRKNRLKRIKSKTKTNQFE